MNEYTRLLNASFISHIIPIYLSQDRKSGYTTVRHLLSADTRDDRVAWCTVLQKAIDNIRAWDPRAFRSEHFIISHFEIGEFM